jgi:hypothetical protein
MDWEMIIVFSVMSLVLGILVGLIRGSFIEGSFFVLVGIGLTVTAVIILITGYDGIIVWVAGPLVTIAPFIIILKIKYPHKLKELDERLKNRK